MAGRSAILSVKVISDATGASKGLDQASQKVGNFQTTLAKKAGPAGKDVGGSLVRGFDAVLGTGLKVVGGAGAVLLGTALTKGFGRLKAIDNAKAKLAGLGHDAGTVEKIMQNATTAVKGTAFGLGEAATTAAQVVAAGVKPGKDLEGVLTTVADVATIAGTSMDEMGSIFGKVAAKNKVQADTLNQLTDRGVPALQLLADHYGVTAAKASEMVSKGKVDFKNFEAAMRKGVGGAAQESGKTFEGAWANVMAALGRIGENLLAPLFDESKSVLQQLPSLLSGVETKAKAVGEAIASVVDWTKRNTTLLKVLGTVAAGVFAGMLVIRTVIAAWQAYNAVLAVVKAAQLGFAAASYGSAAATTYMTAATTAQKVAILAGAAAQKVATAAQWAWNAAMSANPIMLVVLAVAALVAAIILLWTKCKGFRTFVIAMWKAIQSAAVATWNAIRTAASAVLNWLRSAVTATGNAVKTVWRAIQSAAKAAWNGVRSAVSSVVSWIRSAISGVGSFVRSVWNGIRSAASTAWNGVRAVVSGVVSGIRAYLSALRAAASAVWSGIRSAGTAAWNALRSVASSALNAIRGPLNAIRSAASSVWSSVRSAGSAAFNALRSAASGALNAILAPFRAIQSAVNSVIGAVQSLIGWISRIKIPKLPSFLGKLVGQSAAAPAPETAAYSPLAARAVVRPSPTLGSVMGGNSAPQLSGPAVVYNVTLNGVLDGPDAARKVRGVIRDDSRRRGGVVVDASSRRRTR